MPNRKTHVKWGVFTGLANAVVQAKDQEPADMVVETIGGGFGGYAGGRLPDILEPSRNNPRHREFFHSLVFAAFGKTASKAWLKKQQDDLRRAADLEMRRASASQGLAALWHVGLSVLLRIAAGSLAGLVGGYASHLLLDAGDKSFLPVV